MMMAVEKRRQPLLQQQQQQQQLPNTHTARASDIIIFGAQLEEPTCLHRITEAFFFLVYMCPPLSPSLSHLVAFTWPTRPPSSCGRHPAEKIWRLLCRHKPYSVSSLKHSFKRDKYRITRIHSSYRINRGRVICIY